MLYTYSVDRTTNLSINDVLYRIEMTQIARNSDCLTVCFLQFGCSLMRYMPPDVVLIARHFSINDQEKRIKRKALSGNTEFVLEKRIKRRNTC